MIDPRARLPLYIDPETGDTRVEQATLDRIVALGMEGKTRAAFAKALGVSKSAIDKWRKQYPEFAEAYDIATTAAQAWWETFGQDNLITERGETFNQTVWHRFMAAHFKDDWMEQREVTTRDGDREDLTKLTDDELDTQIAEIEAQREAREQARAAAAAARAKARRDG